MENQNQNENNLINIDIIKTPQKPKLQIEITGPTTDSKSLSNNTAPISDEIVFSLPTCKTTTTRSEFTSPSKFNPLPSTTSASTNFGCDNSFFSCEDTFFTPPVGKTLAGTAVIQAKVAHLTLDKVVFIKNQLKNETANFSGYTIGDEGAKKISELLLSSQFSYSPMKRSQVSKVRELKFTKSGIGDEGFSHLSNCLEKSNSIHTIVLNKNKVKDESYTNILNLIKNNKQLKFLNLSGNLLTPVIKEKIKNISKNLNSNLKIEI